MCFRISIFAKKNWYGNHSHVPILSAILHYAIPWKSICVKAYHEEGQVLVIPYFVQDQQLLKECQFHLSDLVPI